MSLALGARLGPYEILAPIGAGGMGEVYRARDTRLNREVAIKLSKEHFSDRFEREAHSIAALNHPNVCTLHDVGPNYLVMELVEGPTLADRIKEGPVPLEDALAIAKQIAEALEAAHEHGIVHRDLKPGNVKIKPDGTVKVLDFGLAKVAEALTEGSPKSSPTLTLKQGTLAGVILGTAAYMAPEQARGKKVDKRADIWAFGVVLYEVLTGRQAFNGETITDVLASVVKEELDLTRLPAEVRRLLRSCLQKDPKQRLQAIADWRLLLEDTPQVEGLYHGSKLPWVGAAVAILATLVLAFFAFRRPTEEKQVVKFSVMPPVKSTFAPLSIPSVSPDGHRMAFVAALKGNPQLWVRDMDSLTARPLAGTELANNPFWSPDSRFIAFFAGGKLKKINVAGGPALSLCDATGPSSGSWNKNGVIVFAHGSPSSLLSRVSATGGSASPAIALDPVLRETSLFFPWFLPDGHHFLYAAYTAGSTDLEKTAVYVADLDSKSRHKVLASNSNNVVYTPPGYLLFLREQTLMAQPFDPGKAETAGEAVPIAEGVDHSPDFVYGTHGLFSVSLSGVLVYLSGGSADNLQLTWFDRSGKAVGTVGAPGIMEFPEISPDGNTVVVDRLDPRTGFVDLWLLDVKRGAESRFTFTKTNDSPEWSPDGRHIVFSSTRDGVRNLYQKATGGAAQDEPLIKSVDQKFTDDWSRDGRYIIYNANDPSGKGGIFVLPLFGDRKPFPYLTRGSYAKLSPNVQWLAFSSGETGRSEIYVQTFPTPSSKWQVSTSGGSVPIWSRDGKELFFVGPDRKLMAAEVKNGTKFEVGVPKPLFDMHAGPNPWFTVSKGGRFLIPTPVEQDASVPMTVVLNWTAGLKK